MSLLKLNFSSFRGHHGDPHMGGGGGHRSSNVAVSGADRIMVDDHLGHRSMEKDDRGEFCKKESIVIIMMSALAK